MEEADAVDLDAAALLLELGADAGIEQGLAPMGSRARRASEAAHALFAQPLEADFANSELGAGTLAAEQWTAEVARLRQRLREHIEEELII